MQNVTSNLVYVVSLSPRKLGGSGLSSRDIAVEHDRYFHPMGGGRGGWPKTPPNYLRFRFDGRLQQIRHVESYEVVHNAAEKGMPGFPQLQGRLVFEDPAHLVYTLGPPILPPRAVKTGNLYRAQRVEAAIDLLLTCETISEARDRTRKRLQAAGEL